MASVVCICVRVHVRGFKCVEEKREEEEKERDPSQHFSVIRELGTQQGCGTTEEGRDYALQPFALIQGIQDQLHGVVPKGARLEEVMQRQLGDRLVLDGGCRGPKEEI